MRVPLRWPVRARLYWCPSCGAPLYSETCSRCGGRGYELPVTPPGDYRPALRGDMEKIRAALLSEFGTDKLLGEIAGGVVVLNRVPYADEMREVFSRGVLMGKVYYDPSWMEWRFRLSWWTARLAVDMGIVATHRLSPGEPLEPIIVKPMGVREGGQVVILDSDGDPVAVGYYRRGAIHLQTRLRGRREPLGRIAGVRETLEANEWWLRRLSSRASGFIYSMASKKSGRVAVSYSGGKDSLVTLDLVVRNGYEPVIVFNDTGLELPETVREVFDAASRYGLEVVRAAAGDAFWRNAPRLGPPARDYRWCCKVVKLAPMARLVRGGVLDGYINFVGQRAFESIDRARTPRVWRNRYFPSLLNASPIQEWNAFMVWLYIFKRGLRYNPLYDEGFERLGCYMCPAGSLAEFRRIEELHPGLWSRWRGFLEKWRLRIGAPREWVTMGLWRWLQPVTHKRRLGEASGAGRWVRHWRSMLEKWAGMRPSMRIGDGFIEVEAPGLDPRGLVEQATVLGRSGALRGGVAVLTGPRGSITYDGRVLRVEGRDVEEALDALKLLVRWRLCTGCGSCAYNCPRGAVVGYGEGMVRVDPSRCIHCRLCIDSCVVCDVYVEHILVPLILGDVRAYKRPGKRRVSEVIRTAKRLHGAAVEGRRAAAGMVEGLGEVISELERGAGVGG